MEVVQQSVVYLHHILQLFKIIDPEECLRAWGNGHRIISNGKHRINITYTIQVQFEKKKKRSKCIYIHLCTLMCSYICLLGNTLKMLTAFMSLQWDCEYNLFSYLYVSQPSKFLAESICHFTIEEKNHYKRGKPCLPGIRFSFLNMKH